MYWLILIIGLPITIVLVTILLDESFWQGLRNNWWLDSLKHKNKKLRRHFLSGTGYLILVLVMIFAIIACTFFIIINA